ncbi:MAG: type II secretion system protein [Planctomycetota bacterium]
MQRRGFVLLIVVAILGVLSFMALELAQKSRDYRGLSLNNLNKVKATQSARSAIERAITIQIHVGPTLQSVPFEQRLEPVHEDRNRNGILDPGEDLDGDSALTTYCRIEDEATPSFALAEDPTQPLPVARSYPVGGQSVGATWMDNPSLPSILASVRVHSYAIDINSGVESGWGDEGNRMAIELGHPYSATSCDHPFNNPLVRFLNAWGNYHKYRHMVRTDKTYDWTLEVDNDFNLPLTPAVPGPQFDAFHHSERCPGETPLGQAIVLARPAKGYNDLGICVDMVRDYVMGWRDLNGAPLPGITLAVANKVVDEFRALAALNPPRQEVTLMLKGPVDPTEVAYTTPLRSGSPYLKDGSLAQQRDRYNVRVYHPKMCLLNINRMPPSMMAAFIHGMGDVWIWELGGPNIEVINPAWSFTHSLVLKPFFDNLLCENNHLVNSWNWEPLLSLTESLHYGSQIAAGRPYSSWGALWKKVTSIQKGYDAKNHAALTAGVIVGTKRSNITDIAGFTDVFRGGERQGLLACLMNPHLNLNSLVIDEALPNPLPNRINGLGISPVDSPTLAMTYGNRDFGTRRMFDKKDPHKVSGWACLDSTFLNVEALGRSLTTAGDELARSHIHTIIELFQVIDIHSQKDWDAVCRHPLSQVSTLAPENSLSFWISYPEIPGVPLADWDGHLALKPSLDLSTSDPWGSSLRARVGLSPYTDFDNTPTYEVNGMDVWPTGPRVIPLAKHPHKIDFRNSLNPPPTGSRGSLLATSFADIDSTSDLMPGGGIRMSSFGNTASMDHIDMPGHADNTRKQAILTLRNALVQGSDDDKFPDPNWIPTSGGHVLPSPQEGLVSFYYKPNFIPEWKGSGSKTLFFAPFYLLDKESINVCPTLGPPYNTEGYMRSLYTGYLRLVWSSLPVNAPRVFRARADMPNWGSGGGSASLPPVGDYPFVHPFGTCTPTAVLPVHYFSGLSGLSGTLNGNLITGGTFTTGLLSGTPLFTASSWSAPKADAGHWGNINPYPNEIVLVEYVVTKYATLDLTVPSPTHPRNPSWDSWDPEDDFSPLARNLQYMYIGSPGPTYNLFDYSDPAHCEHHTVRKVMVLNHPVNINGIGPVDADGNHQPMVMPGRWNHFVVAWRNMDNLLNNSQVSHRGGCVAVYLNGYNYKAVTVAPQPVMTMAGLFVQSDVSLGYFSDPGNPPFYSPWAPGAQHSIYDKPPYVDNKKTSLVPWPKGPSAAVDNSTYLHIPSFGSLGSTIRSYDLTFALGQRDYLFPELNRSIPPRFYFGCQPLDLLRPDSSNAQHHPVFTVSGIAWGSFMDIQIYSSPAPSILQGDGGFTNSLATSAILSALAPYQTNKSLNIFPLNINRQWPSRLVQLRMTAHNPIFHQYWDENSNNLGPQSSDSNALKTGIYAMGSPVPIFSLVQSQDPAEPVVTVWTPAQRPQLQSFTDLKCELVYKAGGSYTITATPIIESLEMTLTVPPKFSGYTQE